MNTPGVPFAIVVLGCRAQRERERGRDRSEPGRLAGALGRRVREAARLFHAASLEARDPAFVLATGGCRWEGEVEADAMASELETLGVPKDRIVRDRCSLSTRENARYSAEALRKRGVTSATVVTCAWHLPRALSLFRREGIDARGAPVDGPRAPLVRSIWRWGRERVALHLFGGALALASLTACPKGGASAPSSQDAAAPATTDLGPIARAEDQRRAKDIPDATRSSHDVTVRRRAARALARIADDASVAGLMRALVDDDVETSAWGAYGLGATCPRGASSGPEGEAHVRALIARAVSIGDDGTKAGGVDATTSIARALGRCGGALAEAQLASWVRIGKPARREAAIYALGDIAGAKRVLADETMTALVDAAAGRPDAPPIDVALFPFGRMDRPNDGFVGRILVAARAALARPGDARQFAVRALGRCGPDAVPDLVNVAGQKAAFTPGERAAAALSLGQLGKEGHAGAAQALAFLVPDRDPMAIAALGGDEYGVMRALLGSIGNEPPKTTEASLYVLANLAVPGNASASLASRIAELRCSAAGALARGAYDTELLRKCDDESSEAFARARLASLLTHHPLAAELRAAWQALAKSSHVRVREAALDGLDAHPELKDAARAALAEALASTEPGLVATAAEAIFAHPERTYTLARSEIRAALDPRAPPPTADPAQEIDPSIVTTLKAALAHAWAEDLVETRAALLKAAIALGLKEGRAAATTACRDANATMRKEAQGALRSVKAAGEDAGVVACKAPDTPTPPADELAAPLERPTKVTFDLDVGSLAITFEPALAPIAATRLVALARSGFYKGIVVHRVVPGFVAQFGDPGGDGYGGAGKLLRCETSPVAFEPFDVGIALAGRDTGSSQLFVTLARTPHLDGEYTRVGHADGDWAGVAEGDVIRDVRVSE